MEDSASPDTSGETDTPLLEPSALEADGTPGRVPGSAEGVPEDAAAAAMGGDEGRRKGTRYSLKRRSSVRRDPVTLVQCMSSCGNRSSTYLKERKGGIDKAKPQEEQ